MRVFTAPLTGGFPVRALKIYIMYIYIYYIGINICGVPQKS